MRTTVMTVEVTAVADASESQIREAVEHKLALMERDQHGRFTTVVVATVGSDRAFDVRPVRVKFEIKS